jgi:hypothetical protein
LNFEDIVRHIDIAESKRFNLNMLFKTVTSGKYFNKGVMALDSPHIGHVGRETDDKIVVFGDGKERYDIPLSEIQTTGRNVLIGRNHDRL